MPILLPRILASSQDWLVLDKPAGWLSIPGRGTSAPILSTWLEKETGAPVWVIHRLDRDTSGIILFAKTAEAHRKANDWFQTHSVTKYYDCLATGSPPMPIFKVRAPIAGSPSTTQIEVKERFEPGFLARVRPLTGRRHQIRIHLSAQGFPLWGDVEYRGPREVRIKDQVLAIDRVALHAARLELPTGEVFEAPWPVDFSSWVEKVRRK